MQRLADAAPEEMLASLRGPLQEALQGVQQDVDRPRTCASAEALSGLLACSQTYHSAGMCAAVYWTAPNRLPKALGNSALRLRGA